MKNPGAWAAAVFSLLLHGALIMLFSSVTISGSRSAGAPGKEILTVTLEGQTRPPPPSPPPVLQKIPRSSPWASEMSPVREENFPPVGPEAPEEGEGGENPGEKVPSSSIGSSEVLESSPILGADMGIRLPPDFKPEYPLLARRRKWEGTAKFLVELDREGGLTLLELSESSGHALLDEAGLRALEATKFLPGTPGRGTVVILFRLE